MGVSSATVTDQRRSLDPTGAPYWLCGWEEAGPLTVTAVADGHQAASETVVVAADECHVVTESVDFALQWGLD